MLGPLSGGISPSSAQQKLDQLSQEKLQDLVEQTKKSNKIDLANKLAEQNKQVRF